MFSNKKNLYILDNNGEPLNEKVVLDAINDTILKAEDKLQRPFNYNIRSNIPKPQNKETGKNYNAHYGYFAVDSAEVYDLLTNHPEGKYSQDFISTFETFTLKPYLSREVLNYKVKNELFCEHRLNFYNRSPKKGDNSPQMQPNDAKENFKSFLFEIFSFYSTSPGYPKISLTDHIAVVLFDPNSRDAQFALEMEKIKWYNGKLLKFNLTDKST